MTLRMRELFRGVRIRAGRVFVAAAVLSGGILVAGTADAQTVSNYFLYPFNPAVSKITLAPAARFGLFRLSDVISIVTTDGSPIRVIDLSGNVVYSGAPTTLQPGLGHYFVECNGDRTQFCVLPNDYGTGSLLGMDAVDIGEDTNILSAMGPSWVRMLGNSGALWNEVQPSAGVWDWSTADKVVPMNAGAGRKIIWDAFLRPDWVTDDNQFISLYSNYVSQVAQRYGSQLYAIEVWNEPGTV